MQKVGKYSLGMPRSFHWPVFMCLMSVSSLSSVTGDTQLVCSVWRVRGPGRASADCEGWVLGRTRIHHTRAPTPRHPVRGGQTPGAQPVVTNIRCDNIPECPLSCRLQQCSNVLNMNDRVARGEVMIFWHHDQSTQVSVLVTRVVTPRICLSSPVSISGLDHELHYKGGTHHGITILSTESIFN